jgi:23S rRNA (pseudouridine1915-N3)-methyltransferase
MRFTIAVVGAPRDAALASAISDYETRAARYWPLQVVEVREAPARGRTVDEIRGLEAERLRAACGSAAIWVCTEGGTAYDSASFAQWMQGLREAARDVAICIGGAFGVDRGLIASAAGRLALAPFTVPHEMARLILGEQLYRAGTLVRGEPYHK